MPQAGARWAFKGGLIVSEGLRRLLYGYRFCVNLFRTLMLFVHVWCLVPVAIVLDVKKTALGMIADKCQAVKAAAGKKTGM